MFYFSILLIVLVAWRILFSDDVSSLHKLLGLLIKLILYFFEISMIFLSFVDTNIFFKGKLLLLHLACIQLMAYYLSLRYFYF